MTHQDFIDTLVPLIRKYCTQYSFPFISPILAQAILESNWGTSIKAQHYNFFGLKYTTAQRTPSAAGFFYDGGSEQLSNGKYVTLDPKAAKWCNFTSFDDGIHGYFEFLTNGYGRYNNLLSATSPVDYLTKIRADGYATSLNYVQNLNNVIVKNNLTQYDTIQKKGESPRMDGLNIIQHTSVHNLTPAPGRKIEWIVLHYTAGVTSKAGTAKNTASWFMNQQCKASADYIVDDATIVQYNPAPQGYYSWAVGGKKYSTLSTSLGAKYYGVAKNNNTINIEICSSKHNTSSLQATDLDWYFTDAVLEQTIKLVQHLMLLYHIDIDHVIMHHMVTGKICPNPWSVKENALQGWYDFKERVQQSNSSKDVSFKVKILKNNVNIRNTPNGPQTMLYTGKGIFTIVEEQFGWGLLKSYANKRNGWIYLDNPGYIERI